MSPVERAWRGSKNDWRLHLLSVFSVAVAFVCLAASVLVVVNVHGVRVRWAESGRASVFLKPDASHEQVETIQKALRASEGVTDARFVSSEDTRRELLGQKNDEVLSALPADAFPASIEVRVADQAAAERLEKLSSQLSALLFAWPLVRLLMLLGIAAARLRLLTHARWAGSRCRLAHRALWPVLVLNAA